MEKLRSVKPYLFGEFLIIAFTKDWINLFNTIPEFDVFLDKGKLVLITKESIKK